MTAFTDRWLRGLKPGPDGYDERDSACPGFCIRVGKRGRKVFEAVASVNGKRRRVRIGQYPDVSLAAARRKASELRCDPVVAAAPMRMRELFEMYEAERAASLRSWRDIQSAWRGWVEPRVGNVRLEDLSIRHGAELVAYIGRNSSANRARSVIRCTTPMLKFAAGRGLMRGNPWRDLSLPAGAASRDRVLSRDEWQAVADWATAEPYPWGPFVRFLMFSAQRLSTWPRCHGRRLTAISGSSPQAGTSRSGCTRCR